MDNVKIAAVMVLAILVMVTFFSKNDKPFGGATSGLQSGFASTSSSIVGTGYVTIAATSTGCSARIISTTATPVMLTFSQSPGTLAPSGSYGHYQAGSTTVVYDGGLYGCDAISAFGYVAGQPVYVTVEK